MSFQVLVGFFQLRVSRILKRIHRYNKECLGIFFEQMYRKGRTRILRRALLASAAPAGSHGAAALSLGCSRHSRVEAHPPAVVVEAELLSDVDALLTVGTEDEAFGTLANETAILVDAVAILAQTHIDLTFVDV